METLIHGMTLTATPFISTCAAITLWWALADLSRQKMKGARSASWIFLAILLPPLGFLLYLFTRKQQRPNPAG